MDGLRQGIALGVHQSAAPGLAAGEDKVRAVQHQAGGGGGGIVAAAGNIPLGRVQLHIGEGVGLAIPGDEAGGLTGGDVISLLVVVGVGLQVLLVGGLIDVLPVKGHGPGNTVDGDVQMAGSGGDLVRRGLIVQVDKALQRVAAVLGDADQARPVLVVLIYQPLILIDLHIGGLQVHHPDGDGAVGLQAGEVVHGQLEVLHLRGGCLHRYDAQGGVGAVGHGDDGLAGSHSHHMTELIHRGHLGVAGGAGDGRRGAGVVVHAEVKALAGVQAGGCLGQGQALGGVHLDGIGAVIGRIVAAGEIHVAGPVVAAAILRHICGEGEGVGIGVINALGIQGIQQIDVVLGDFPAGGVGIGPAHLGVDRHGGQGAVLVIDGALHIGAAILLIEGHGVVLQLGGLGVHQHVEGEHVAGLVHFVAVEGGLLAVHEGLEVRHRAAQLLIVHGVAVVTLAIGGNGVNALGAVGQDVAVQVRSVPGIREVVKGHGQDHAVAGLIDAAGHIGVEGAEIELVGVLVPDLGDKELGIPQLIELKVVNGVEIAAAVRGDGKVLLVENCLLALGGNVGIKDVLAQVQEVHHFPGAADGTAHHVDAQGTVVVHHVFAVLGLVEPVGAVQDGGRGPVAQEGQQGHADLRRGAVGGGEDHKALHIAAVGEQVADGGDVGSGEGNGPADLCAAGGHADAAQIHLTDQHIAGKDHGLAVLLCGIRPQKHGLHAVAQGVAAQVLHPEVQIIAAAPAGIVAQLQLAHQLAVHIDVGRGGNGRGCVHKAGALAAGRDVYAVLLLGHGGAHQQMVGQVGAGGGVLLGMLGLDILLHQRGQARHMGRRHGGAAHQTVGPGIVIVLPGALHIAAVHHGGPDVAAGGGDLGLQLQSGAAAPGGEGGHLAALLPVGQLVLLVNGDADLLPGVQRIDHGRAVHAGNKGGGQRGVVRVHVDKRGGGGVAVINQHSQHAVALAHVVGAGEAAGIVDLVGEGEGAAVCAAALDQGNTRLAAVVAVAESGVVVVHVGAVARVIHNEALALGELPLHGHFVGVGEGHGMALALGVVPAQHTLHVDGAVDGGHRQVGGVDGGRGHHGDIRVLRQVQAAPLIALGGGVFAVAGGGHQNDAGLLQPGINAVDGGVVIGKAVVGAQRQVHSVGAQGHGVLQGVENGAFRGAGVAAVGKDLHHHQLGIGGYAGEEDLALLALDKARHGAGDVGAVVAAAVADVDVAADDLAGIGVGVSGVVKGEGDLAGLVHGLVGGGAQPIGIELAAVQESQQGLLGIAQVAVAELGVEGVVPEGLVDPAQTGDVSALLIAPPAGILHVQAGIHHGHQHSLAGVALVPDLLQVDHVIAVACHTGIGGRRGGLTVNMLHMGGLHTLQIADGIQHAIGGADGHAVKEHRPLLHQLRGTGSAGALRLESGGLGRLDLGKNLFLIPANGGILFLRAAAGKIGGDLRTGRAGGSRFLRGKALQHGSALQLHEDGHHIIGLMPGGLGGFRRRVVLRHGVQPGGAADLLRLHHGPVGGGGFGGQSRGHQAQQHDQRQQQCDHSFHVIHSSLVLNSHVLHSL